MIPLAIPAASSQVEARRISHGLTIESRMKAQRAYVGCPLVGRSAIGPENYHYRRDAIGRLFLKLCRWCGSA